jgi:hypothetical protein
VPVKRTFKDVKDDKDCKDTGIVLDVPAVLYVLFLDRPPPPPALPHQPVKMAPEGMAPALPVQQS